MSSRSKQKSKSYSKPSEAEPSTTILLQESAADAAEEAETEEGEDPLHCTCQFYKIGPVESEEEEDGA